METSHERSAGGIGARGWPALVAALAITCLMGLPMQGCSQDHHTDSGDRLEPKAFASPDDAVRTLVTAVRNDDMAQLRAIMGSEGEQIISSGDEVADKQSRQEFVRLYDLRHSLVNENPDTVTLLIGDKDWPFPVPVVREAQGWAFDPETGREEILNRRIGQNELSAIQVCKAIADAEHEYALRDPIGRGTNEYAQQFASDPEKRNGLYWPTAPGEQASPLGALAAQAAAEGYTRREHGPTPYHGYYYRILRKQGPSAPNGEVNYVVDGRMLLGFAVLAYPAEYGNSGIMTFIMGPDGVVYQKDLGEKTAQLAGEMDTFDPDASWVKVQ